MIQKKTVEVPKFETVQVGVDVKETWVTSDGMEFSDVREAEYHEFEWRARLRNKQFDFPEDIQVLTFETRQELEEYAARHFYSDENIAYNTDSLAFPTKVVAYRKYIPCDCDDYEYCYCNVYDRYIATIPEFKAMILRMMDEVREDE